MMRGIVFAARSKSYSKSIRVTALLILQCFFAAQIAWAAPAMIHSCLRGLRDSETEVEVFGGLTAVPKANTPGYTAVIDEAGAASTGTGEHSAILVKRSHVPDMPIELASFILGESAEPKVHTSIQHIRHRVPEGTKIYEAMREELKGLLEIYGITLVRERFIVRACAIEAAKMIRELLRPMSLEYNLDERTEVKLVWGSVKLARYEDHVLTIDVAALVSTGLLSAELYHEILHPLVALWLDNMHIDLDTLYGRFYCAVTGAAAMPSMVAEPPESPFAGQYPASRLSVPTTEEVQSALAAIAEIYVIYSELNRLDVDSTRESFASALHMYSALLDHATEGETAGFGNLLTMTHPDETTKKDEVLSHVFDFICDNSGQYSEKLQRGIKVLEGLKEANPLFFAEAMETVVRYLDEKLAVYECAHLQFPPQTLDDVAALIDDPQNKIALLEVRFVDTADDHMKGQRKSVLCPVNKALLALLESGISFDGSSIRSSVHGKPLGDIFRSDFIATMAPNTFRIRNALTLDGKRIAVIDAEVSEPFEAAQQRLKLPRGYGFIPRELISIDRTLSEQNAREAAVRGLQDISGLSRVNLIIANWSGWSEPLSGPDGEAVSVKPHELMTVFNEGKRLTPENIKHLPLVPLADGSKNYIARPDPCSLKVVDFGHHVEAFMCASLEEEGDRSPAMGVDFRRQLKMLSQRYAKKHMKFMAAAEPEFFLLRKIEGRFVTADSASYYSEFTELPRDVQACLMEIMETAERAGFNARYVHHEVAPGQYEMPVQYGEALEVADNLMLFMHIVRRISKKHGLYASFLPKPIDGVNGSGMHMHMSVQEFGEDGSFKRNLFFDQAGPHHLSGYARHFIAGVLKYAYATLPLTNPFHDCFLRLVRHFEAPVALGWGSENRSCAVRIPFIDSERAARIEYRVPDPSGGSTHAKFLAVLLAGLQGVNEEIEPPDAMVEASIFDMSPVEKVRRGVEELPGADRFFGIDGELASKAAVAIMLSGFDKHPKVGEYKREYIKAIEKAEYDKLDDTSKELFKHSNSVQSDQEAEAVFEKLRRYALNQFNRLVDHRQFTIDMTTGAYNAESFADCGITLRGLICRFFDCSEEKAAGRFDAMDAGGREKLTAFIRAECDKIAQANLDRTEFVKSRFPIQALVYLSQTRPADSILKRQRYAEPSAADAVGGARGGRSAHRIFGESS